MTIFEKKNWIYNYLYGNIIDYNDYPFYRQIGNNDTIFRISFAYDNF